MSTSVERTPSLTPSPSRSPSPVPQVQPDHFYSPDGEATYPAPLSPGSSGSSWLTPDSDPLATKGIPVFKPTMKEFQDFEAYMNRVESWGMRSGIVKIIPPKEWRDSLPSTVPQLANVHINSPIEQHMLGHAGMFRVQNVVRRKVVSVREWAELCAKEDLRAPATDEVGLKSASEHAPRVKRRNKRREAPTAKEEETLVKDEAEGAIHLEESAPMHELATPMPGGEFDSDTDLGHEGNAAAQQGPVSKSLPARKRRWPTRADREAAQTKRDELDRAFLETFNPHTAWLPRNTSASDYTPSFCATLERRYWRNCGLGKPPWYGADTAGTLFTDATTSWNVGCLPSALSRLLPKDSSGLPGVNTPYLYFGMWRATFAWHVEDMDLHSINYIHWGAPKHWYAIPQGRALQLENTLRSFFPRDASNCRQFLRHKAFHASPTLLAQQGCKPNVLVQHAGEFVITYPRGYHAGFNLGFNCAESVNFALDSWLEIGRKAQACGCIGDSVRIDVDALLWAQQQERWAEKPSSNSGSKESGREGSEPGVSRSPKKRKSDALGERKSKKQKVKPSGASETGKTLTTPIKHKIMLKIPRDPGLYPCCLCISREATGLLRVQGPPSTSSGCQNVTPKDAHRNEIWRAHEKCAMVVPETWVDEHTNQDGQVEKVVFGVDAIPKDRWALKCTLCQKSVARTHGAPIQCTRGECPRAFHISCACDGGQENRVQFTELREIEREVVFYDIPAVDAVPPVQGAGVSGMDHPETSVAIDPALLATAACLALEEDVNQATAQPRTAKSIKKIEYELFCTQHNPAAIAARRASKADRVRTELLALPHMSRIKLRVSFGVYEVSLLCVNEERGTVEVIWDHGIKREFKWSSVVLGKTETQIVGQKPNVAAFPDQPAWPRPNECSAPEYGSLPATPSHITQTSPPTGATQSNPPPVLFSPYYINNNNNNHSGKFQYSSWTNLYYPYTAGAPIGTAKLSSSTPTPETGPPYTCSTNIQPHMASLTWSPPILGQQEHATAFSRSIAQTVAMSVASLPPRSELATPRTSLLYGGSNSTSSTETSQPATAVSNSESALSVCQPAEGSAPVASTDAGSKAVPPEVMQIVEQLKNLSSLDPPQMKELFQSNPSLAETIKLLLEQQASSTSAG